MPSTICNECRNLMDYFYRFKQICRTSDTKLKQFPLTGQWPNALELPKLPLQQSSKVRYFNNLFIYLFIFEYVTQNNIILRMWSKRKYRLLRH